MPRSPFPHPCERLRHRRADRPAADTECPCDLLLGEAEVVVRDDDRALPLGEQREKATDLQAMQHRRRRVAPRELRQRAVPARAEEAPPRFAERDAIEPTLQVAVVGWRVPETFLEGVVQTVERAFAIERRRDESAVHLRK